MQAVEDDGGRERLTARSLNLYKLAAAALTDAIGLVVGACTPGATALKICSLGDSKITEYLQNVAKSIKDKGVAFPTCLSINSDACHFCPLPSDDTILSEKDIVKIEMACHIDGFIASQVHTVVVTPSPRSDRITRRAADVICAVNKAAEIISDVVGPGTKLKDFNEIIQGVAHCFSCTVLSISACRLLKQYDSKESLLSISTLAEAEFLKDRAYIIDIAFATEHGELELSDGNQTTVYKSMMNAEYQLEDERLMPIFEEINQKFPKMPFCVRSLENYAKESILALEERGLLQPYHILRMKSGFTAHVRFTYVMRSASSARVTIQPQQARNKIKASYLTAVGCLWEKSHLVSNYKFWIFLGVLILNSGRPLKRWHARGLSEPMFTVGQLP